MIGAETHNFSIKEIPGSAMAAADGSGSVGGSPNTANGGGILFGSPQRTHPLQRPQQSQSRRRSQGNNSPHPLSYYQSSIIHLIGTIV